MNNRISKLLATILITAMVLSVIPLFNVMPAIAYPLPPSMYLIPDFPTFYSNTTSVGDTFSLTLWAAPLTGAFTLSYEVDFNTAQLSAVSAAWTGVGGSQWFSLRQNSTGGWHLPAANPTFPLGPTINNGLGTITGGETCLNPDSVPTGISGSIITMTFQIIAGPPIGGNLTSLISLNPANTWYTDESNNALPLINYGDATYTYVWSPPPAPHLAVEPTSRNYQKFIIWNGTTFTEDIVIKSISNGWFLGNATTDLTYNATLTTVAGVVFDPIWTGTTTWAGNNTGTLTFYVDGPSTIPNGDVKIATITFRIIGQGYVPPRIFGDSDVSALHLLNYQLGSTFGFYITTTAAVNGEVKVYAFSPSLPPNLEVSSATIGPGPSLGQMFNITVSLVNVMDFQNIIGIQFRLGYDPTMLEAVTAYEGPFLPSAAALQNGSLGTFFVSYINNPDGIFGPHVLVGNMIFPNGTGRWNNPMLSGTGVVATITFKVLYQSFGEPNVVTPLNIVDKLAIALDNINDQNIVDGALEPSVNGTVTITTNLPGRAIDLYGGAVNSGLGPLVGAPYLQFPAPYGGQGQRYFNETEQIWHEFPMDMVEPQSWVYLNANVTYNYWPVQFKNVAFEIQMPNGTVYNKFSAFTDSNGVASIGFRMPWPCDINTTSSSLFGVWHITATVQLADVRINDTMAYHYDYLVHVWKVTTTPPDKFQYNHGECVQITFDYGSHAQQTYPALFVVSIVDELGVTVGIATVETTIGGTVFCQYKNLSATVEICLPKWAYAGIATIHINTFDFEPIQGGVPIAPEFVGPTIAIQPY